MKIRQLIAGVAMGAVVVVLPGFASAVAAGAQTIAVVIQFSTGQSPRVLCVNETSAVSSIRALSDALAANGMAAPTFAATGLLCSLNNSPASGCGVQTSEGYQYWSYFLGDGSGWHYSNQGPGTHGATSQVSEGWRFQNAGSGTGSDAPPNISPVSTQLCPAPALSPSNSSPAQPGVTLPVSSPQTNTASTLPGQSGQPPTSSPGSVSVTTTTTRGGGTLAQALQPEATATDSTSFVPVVGSLLAIILVVSAVLLRKRRSS